MTEPDNDRGPDNHLVVEAMGQVEELENALELPADRYLHIPLKPVDEMVSGLPPGSLWFLTAFSGDGKSSLLMSVVERYLNQGKIIAYMGLETLPWKLRVHLACRELNVDPGDIITGAILSHPDGESVRQQVKMVANDLLTLDWIKRIRFFPHSYIGVKELETASVEAVDMEADVMIIDHIDHVQGGDGSDAFRDSVNSIKKLHDLRQTLELTYLVASQLNNEAVKRDPLARYRPAEPQMVYMGAHKRMVADGMLSIYRPIKPAPKDMEEIKAYRDLVRDVRQGLRKAKDLILPNTMGVAVTKHREYNREGQRCYLHIERGKVRELEHSEAAARGLLEESY